MRHVGIKCWADAYDAIISGRKRCIFERPDHFHVGDVVELVRWDPHGVSGRFNVGSTCEVLLTHVERASGPLLLFALKGGHDVVPIVCLSFTFLQAYYNPPLGRSDECWYGDEPEEETPVIDMP